MSNIGTHILVDLYGVELSLLRDEKELMRVFLSALVQEGFTVLQQLSHRFADGGQGVTGSFCYPSLTPRFIPSPSMRIWPSIFSRVERQIRTQFCIA